MSEQNGIVTSAIYITLGLLLKALLDVAYFKDYKSAKRTFCSWLVSIASLGVAFCFSMLFNCLR